MLAVKGRYDGTMVIFDQKPAIKECDVIVNFPNGSSFSKQEDDGSLAYLFRNYIDDGIREPIINFGTAVGNEKW